MRWEATERTTSLDFLDITITIVDGKISTKLYKKALNLYLYLPPHSCHSPSMTRGIITGMIIRIIRLTSDVSQIQPYIQQFYDRLIIRGFSPSTLRPLFQSSINTLSQQHHQQLITAPTTLSDNNGRFYLHVRYHPKLLPARSIQKEFSTNIIQPANEPTVQTLVNHRYAPLPPHTLTVAYHRPHNLGNLLSCRKMDTGDAPYSTYR